jgi:hypothetical protein
MGNHDVFHHNVIVDHVSGSVIVNQIPRNERDVFFFGESVEPFCESHFASPLWLHCLADEYTIAQWEEGVKTFY